MLQRKFIPKRRILVAPTGEAFAISVTDEGYIKVKRTYVRGVDSIPLISPGGQKWLLTINGLGQLKLKREGE